MQAYFVWVSAEYAFEYANWIYYSALAHEKRLHCRLVANTFMYLTFTIVSIQEYIGDLANAVRTCQDEEFVLEALGILGNLTVEDVNFQQLLTDYDMLNYIKTKLQPGVKCSLLLLINLIMYTYLPSNLVYDFGTICSTSITIFEYLHWEKER